MVDGGYPFPELHKKNNRVKMYLIVNEFVFMFTIDDTDTIHTEYPGCHYRWGEYGGGRSLSLVWGGAEAALMLRLGLLL